MGPPLNAVIKNSAWFRAALTSNGSGAGSPEKYGSFEVFLSKNKAVSQAHCCVWALHYRLLSTACLMNEDVREEQLFEEEAACFPGLDL